MEFCYGLLRDLIKSQKQQKQQSSTVLTRRKSWKNILSFSHSNNNLKWNIQQYCCHQWWRACHDDNDDGYNYDCLYMCVCVRVWWGRSKWWTFRARVWTRYHVDDDVVFVVDAVDDDNDDWD